MAVVASSRSAPIAPVQPSLARRVPLLLLVISLVAYLVAPGVQLSDSKYSMLLSESILLHHTTVLSANYRIPQPAFGPGHYPIDVSEANTYQLAEVPGGTTYFYPHGSSILSIPFVALMHVAGIYASSPDQRWNLFGEIVLQKVLAAILTATLVALIDATAMLVLKPLESAVVAVAAAFGSQLLSTASRGMWSETWQAFILGWVVYLLLRSKVRDEAPQTVVIASLLAWTYFVRPLSAISIAAVTVYFFLTYRDRFITYAITGLIWLAAFIAYSLVVFDSYLPAYYLRYTPGGEGVLVGLSGVLISPSRGLLVFVPAVLFICYLVIRYWRSIPHRELAILATAIILLHTFAIATYEEWWGGLCYGARLYLDVLPWFVLLAILGLAAVANTRVGRLGRIEIAAAILLVLIGVAANAPAMMAHSALR